MKSFLQLVASSLLSKFGANLSHLTVVFPGQRASLFLNQALAEASPTPVWAPRYVSISQLFQQASPYTLCDPVESVCRLYRSYAKIVDEPQPLDQFYGWGEVLLSDFDDIDKHLVDVRQLFTNIRDLKALEDNSYITPEQEEALSSFFSNFSLEGNTALKERFLRLWNKKLDIYVDFNTQMREAGLSYEGALQRGVVEGDMSSLSPDGDETTFVFIGFNVLNDVEQALFDELQHRGQALFYWDYDLFYANLRDKNLHEAGYFIRRNLERYGNELSPECFDNLRRPKDITFITASSENAQARYLPQWLDSYLTHPDKTPEGASPWRENQTAVVLCNEQLLQPVLHSIPAGSTPLNVTMGYPLADTPVMGFIMALLNLQTEGYDVSHHRFRPSYLRSVANHPFASFVPEEIWKKSMKRETDTVSRSSQILAYLLEVLTHLGSHFAQEPSPHPLYVEAVFQAYTCINRLYDMTCGEMPLLCVSENTLSRVIRSVLQSKSIPFHGEPAVGLQVMGVLETRSLDFRHLLMLSVGEGFLPKTVSDNSFIPYHLKEAFGLTTVKHKIAVYAYYFYRLIQRVEHVTFMFNQSNAGSRQNEISRFLRQLLAETDFPIRQLKLQSSSNVVTGNSISIAKTPKVMEFLLSHYDNTGRKEKRTFLSPSAMNSYTTCPLQFYYKYVQGMRVDPDPADGLDAILFGNVFHKAAELLYGDLTARNEFIQARDIENMLEQGGVKLDQYVRTAFRSEFFKDREEDYTGILLIAVRVVRTYLEQLLRHDLKLCPFRLLEREQSHTTTLLIPYSNRNLEIDTGGIIDRLDEVNDPNVEGVKAIRVVDYKTGGKQEGVESMDQLFQDTGQREHYFFQTFLYAVIVSDQMKCPVTPCLFYVHRSGTKDFSPKLKFGRKPVHDIRSLREEFIDHLHSLIAEIFDPNVPFLQTENENSCKYCDFRKLCNRG